MGFLRRNQDTIALNRVTIGREFCLFKLNSVPEKGLRILERESAICRPGD